MIVFLKLFDAQSNDLNAILQPQATALVLKSTIVKNLGVISSLAFYVGISILIAKKNESNKKKQTKQSQINSEAPNSNPTKTIEIFPPFVTSLVFGFFVASVRDLIQA